MRNVDERVELAAITNMRMEKGSPVDRTICPYNNIITDDNITNLWDTVTFLLLILFAVLQRFPMTFEEDSIKRIFGILT